ncbi:zinc-ribbon domain-containing protein [Chloroflexota bacterium]
MSFCPKCGNEVTNQDQFCSKCGMKLVLKETKEAEPPRKKYTDKWWTVLRYLIMVAVAIIGGLPLFLTRVYNPESEFNRIFPGLDGWSTVRSPLWDSTGAIVAFMIIAAGVNLYFIRYQSTKIQVITTIILFGVLLAIASGVKSLN